MMFLLKGVSVGLFSALIMVIGNILNKNLLPSKSQGTPFECGINVLEFSEVPMSMRFFMLTVVFLIFDVELVLLMPFIIYLFMGSNSYLIVVFVVFLMVLLFGVFVEWNAHILEWN